MSADAWRVFSAPSGKPERLFTRPASTSSAYNGICVWDWDLPAAPILIDVRRNGRVVPAVAQITKMGLLFVLHRETGQPIYGVEERPVPQTKAPGEWTSPTQPFPLKPAPLARMSMTKAELAGIGKISPEHETFCRDLWERNNVADSAPDRKSVV